MKMISISAVLLGALCAPVLAAPRNDPHIMLLKGHCDRLQAPQSNFTESCEDVLSGTSYQNGRAGFYFVTKDGFAVTFTGMGTGQVKPDPDSAIQPVDGVIFGFRGKSDSIKAVGLCKFANPFAGRPTKVSCIGEIAEGQFVGDFTTDGSEPSISPK